MSKISNNKICTKSCEIYKAVIQEEKCVCSTYIIDKTKSM